MPYISQEARGKFAHIQGHPVDIANSGELNYLLTMFVNEYLHQHGKRYATMNDIVGALDGAKAEFQARVVRPYEDEKIKENGDVYDVT